MTRSLARYEIRWRRISSRSWWLSVARSPRSSDAMMSPWCSTSSSAVCGRLSSLIGEDEVVLGQRGLPRLGHRGLQAIGDRAARLLGLPLERFVFDELIGRVGQIGPGAVEVARQPQRDDAVVEQLEADAKAVNRREVDAGAVEEQRRLLISDVGRRRGLRCELRADAAADRRRRGLKIGRLGDVEEVEREDLPMEDCSMTDQFNQMQMRSNLQSDGSIFHELGSSTKR